MRISLILLALLSACGGPSKTSPQSSVPQEQTVETNPPIEKTSSPPTAAECEKVIVHAMTVLENERQQKDPTSGTMSESVRTSTLRSLRQRLMPDCLSSDRATLQCRMKAQSREELLLCDKT